MTIDDGQGTMWDYWQETPRGKTEEEELKELCSRLANCLDHVTYVTGHSLTEGETSDLEKGLSYAT